MKHLTEAHKRKMKAFLVVVALPFCALLFYALGGGRADPQEMGSPNALNPELPAPDEKQAEKLDKLSLYEKVDQDSARQLENESNSLLSIFSMKGTEGTGRIEPGQVENPFSAGAANLSLGDGLPDRTSESQRQLEHLGKKMAEIQRVLDENPSLTPQVPLIAPPSDSQPELSRLESVMASVQDSPGQDQELSKLSGMLDKVLDIQHPNRVMDRLKSRSEADAGAVFTVTTLPDNAHQDYFGFLQTDSSGKLQVRSQHAFYDNSTPDDTASVTQTAIQASIHDEQVLVSGSTIKIRLLQPIFINGQLVRKGSFVFGACTLSGERLLVSVTSIRSGNILFPVRLSIFDLDGNPGIRIPGSISRDASKQSADQAIQSVALSSLDPSIGAQAAAAGIETAKGLLSKRVRLVRVTVKSGYPVLLFDNQRH